MMRARRLVLRDTARGRRLTDGMQKREEEEAEEETSRPTVEEMIAAAESAATDPASSGQHKKMARGMKEVLCQILTRRKRTG